jgi:APA family basic amino acid/polyamine antiporter
LLLFVFVSTNVAVVVLRKDRIAEPHFRTPTILPVLAIGSCLLLLSQQSGGTWLRAGLLMALGAVLYALGRWQKRRRPNAD